MGKDLAIQILIKKVEEQTCRLEKFGKENKILCHDNAVLKAENAFLKTEIEELKARLESNSHNSNKPPSSDGYKKKTVKPAFAKGKGSKQGGQNGHKGHTLKQVEAPDKIVICTPGACTCGHEFKASCPACGQEQKGVAPEGVNAPVQYGNKVKAFVVLLNVHYKIPYKKIQLLFGDLFGFLNQTETHFPLTNLKLVYETVAL